MRALLLLSVPVLALAGCESRTTDTPTPTPAQTPAGQSAIVTRYTCEDGKPAEARYVGQDEAAVVFDGKTHRMARVVSASGARYAGDGLQWWSKGDNAFRAPLKPGEDVASAPPVTCWSGEPPAVEPPAPGTPGGLPDDRTPISEAPFTPESAQGAANVVQTFYAHLSMGQAAEAAKLARGAQLPDLARYTSYHAQIGAPGPIEGAAGSLFVEVPVVIYARLTTGPEVHQSGRAVLRRSNDVPGATSDQRAWRIERIELK